MSGYPPPGPGGFGQPGFNPGQPQQYSIGAVTRTSGAAVTSLIFGCIGFCVPVIGGLVAIITGFIGIKSTGNPAVKGRAMAIIGLLLGLLTFVGYGAFGTLVVSVMHKTGASHDFAQQYIAELANGDERSAANDCDPNAAPLVASEIAQMQAYGKMSGSFFYSIDFMSTHKATGAITFANGKAHSFEMELKPQPGGTYKVDSFKWKD